MIQTVKTHTCHDCGSDKIVKNGKTRFGNQKYKCKSCGKTKVLVYQRKYSQEQKETILRAYQERSSIRGVCRTFGIAKQTLSNWVKKKQKNYQII